MEPCASAKKIKPAYTESVNNCKLISQRGPIFSKAPVQHVGVSMRITAEKKKNPVRLCMPIGRNIDPVSHSISKWSITITH